MNQLVTAAGMALLAMASVGLWTLRVALTARGRKSIAAAVAAVEAVVFAVAFTNVAAHLDSPARIAGYAAGVAARDRARPDHRPSPLPGGVRGGHRRPRDATRSPSNACVASDGQQQPSRATAHPAR